jgi:hypothetical protein
MASRGSATGDQGTRRKRTNGHKMSPPSATQR